MWNTSRESLLENKLRGHSADVQISQSSVEPWHADVKQMFTQSTTTCSWSSFSCKCLSFSAPKMSGRGLYSSWELNNRNTSTSCRVTGRGEAELVSEIPLCLFQVESGLHSCQKTLWKHETILSPSSFFISLVEVLLFKTKAQQKLCVNALSASFYIVCSCKGSKWK